MWLISSDVFNKMTQAVAAGFTIDAAEQREIVAAAVSDGSRITAIAGDTAEISVTGILTESPDFFARILGGGNTTYDEIIGALAAADANPNVKKAVLAIGSPGGTIDGLFDTLAAIESFSKPIIAQVSSSAESAAFAIAAQADSIVALNPMARFGSIGVAASVFTDDRVVDITSSNAPNKRPNVSTKAGQAVIREELDGIEDVFIGTIASGRGLTEAKVTKDFGRGATVIAAEALKRGMIDSIAKTSLSVVPTKTKTAAISGNQPEASKMDLEQFKAEHLAVYTAVVAAGHAQGVAEERDRTGAFVAAGEASGDMKTALAAIKDGSAMTQTLSTTFLMAAANRSSLNAQAGDDTSAANAAAAAASADAGDDGDKVADIVEATLGIKAEG